jgi:putative transposase
MLYFVFAQLLSFMLDLFTTSLISDHEKDVQILVLRQQIRILQRKRAQPPRISRWEKCILATLTVQLKELAKCTGKRLDETILLFKPDTVLKWHRELVRHKWTYKHRQSRGRPRIAPELEELIVRLARENPRWGYSKIQGELRKLGYSIGRSTVRDALSRNHLPPSKRRKSSNWRSFLGHYAGQMVACDFFTVETIRLQTLYVLFFIQLGTRRVYLAGCTPHPTGEWVTQQARNLAWDIQELESKELPMRFLIHDRDTKFTLSFDTVLASEGIEIIQTPYRAPNANAFAERWVRTVREECLDQLLIISEGHLRRVLKEYIHYYNHRRAHQGINQRMPVPFMLVAEEEPTMADPVCRRDLLGGIIHDYYQECPRAA